MAITGNQITYMNIPNMPVTGSVASNATVKAIRPEGPRVVALASQRDQWGTEPPE
jgi:hypothetical protein